MTHHHNHARFHSRLNPDALRDLAKGRFDNDHNEDYHQHHQHHHHHHHQHRDVHSQPEIHPPNEPAAADEPAPEIRHNIARRSEHVVQTVTTYVATQYDLLIESGTKTLGEFTVSTLPAVVTVPNFGVITVPANAPSLITGALPSPVETNAPPAKPSGMAATANIPAPQAPLQSSGTSSSKSDTSQSSATQSAAKNVPPASADADSSVPPVAAPLAAPVTGSTSSTLTRSGSNSMPTSDPDSTIIPGVASSSGSSSTSSGGASTSTHHSTTESTASASTSSATSTFSADPTMVSPIGGGGSLGSATLSPTSSTAHAESSGSSSGENKTPKIAGGVVGGVVGFVFLLILALLFVRWRRRRASAKGVERSFGRDGVFGDNRQSFKPRAPEMSSWRRSSTTPIAAGALFGRRQPSSPGYTDDSPTSERGFQKISGRKIQSVLRTGGDGYGDEIEEDPIPVMPLESPISPASAVHSDYHNSSLVRFDSGDEAVMRPSPARTATTGSSVDLMGSSPPVQMAIPPLRPDSVGRSLSRQDGSRNSRFTERI